MLAHELCPGGVSSCPRVPRALPADVSPSPVCWWDTRRTGCITTCAWLAVLLCNAACRYITRSSCASPASPASPCARARACACACSLYRTLTPSPSHLALALALALLPHLAQLQLQLQLQIPSIAHEHAAALLPHPVPIYLSLPCLPRLIRLAPHAASTLSSSSSSHPHTPPSHPILILALRLCPLPFCALLPSPCLGNKSTTVLRLASANTRHAVYACLISFTPSNESAQETTSHSPLPTKWTCFPS